MRSGLPILITSGATREPIDEVRYLSNISTGGTGARLADFFSSVGFRVTYLFGEGAIDSPLAERKERFTHYESLDQLLRRELSGTPYFAVIHLAAVSDYSVQEVVLGDRSFSPEFLKKVDSGEEMKLILKRNSKILDRLKSYSQNSGGPSPWVVGFKLTNTGEKALQLHAVRKLTVSREVDWVVHNDLSQIKLGSHQFQIFHSKAGELTSGRVCRGTEELGPALIDAFQEKL